MITPPRAIDWSGAGVQDSFGFVDAMWPDGRGSFRLRHTINKRFQGAGQTMYSWGWYLHTPAVLRGQRATSSFAAGRGQDKISYQQQYQWVWLCFEAAIRMCAGSGNIGTLVRVRDRISAPRGPVAIQGNKCHNIRVRLACS